MKTEQHLSNSLMNSYKELHDSYFGQRASAIVYMVLGAISLFVMFGFVVVSERVSMQIFLGATPIVLFVLVLGIWGSAYLAKVRLELLKHILEKEGFVIAAKSDGEVDVFSTPSELGVDAIVAPLGRIKKEYVRLFT